MIAKIIGNKIAEARKKLAISQAQLAEQLFLSPQAVGKWERGESLPDLITCNRLAEIFGVDLNFFSENAPQTAQVAANVLGTETPISTLPTTQSKKKWGLNWNMSQGNWVDADFSGLKNLQDKFNGSNMKNCKFIGSDLSDIRLEGNAIGKCDFSNSNLRNAKIKSSDLQNNQFVGCSFIDARISASEINHCDFSNANFSGVEISTSELRNCVVEDAIWKLTAFKQTGLSNIVFDSTIEDCVFEDCSFSKVIFKEATLLNTFFKGKN
jgi:uncharacterized protein YjbI with pentapeptide repeats